MGIFNRIHRAFQYLWDLFTLFNGVQTPDNLERTQGTPIRTRGIFMFRNRQQKNAR